MNNRKLAALRAAADRCAPFVTPPKKETPMQQQTDLKLAERIVRVAIEQAETKAKAKGKSWRGAHAVYDNLNGALKAAGFAETCTNPLHEGRTDTCEVGKRLLATGAFEMRPAHGGVRFYLAGTAPAPFENGNVAAILAAAGATPTTPTRAPASTPTLPKSNGGARPVVVSVSPDDVV